MESTLSSVTHPAPRFDEDFIERRLSAHREWQQMKAAEDSTAIIREVAFALSLVEHVRYSRREQMNQQINHRRLR